jgi:hypothetical protein
VDAQDKPGQHILSTSAELSRLDTMLPTGFPSLSMAPLRLPGRSPAPLALREDREGLGHICKLLFLVLLSLIHNFFAISEALWRPVGADAEMLPYRPADDRSSSTGTLLVRNSPLQELSLQAR